ncbi:MAG: hypothetical protein ABEJ81_05115 [Haloferacaceae archaeon]
MNRHRGQGTLLATAVAVVLLVGATTLGVAMADGALHDADRRPLDRRAAATLAERLSTANATSYRDGVVRSDRVRNLTAADLGRLAPPVVGRDVRVRLDGKTVVASPDAAGGTTVRRAVRVGRPRHERRQADLGRRRNLTVPAGVGRVRIYVASDENTTVTTVLADDRPVLHAAAGVEGTAVVGLARYDPTRLQFVVETTGNGNVSGRVRIEYRRIDARPAVLEVTVDD